MELGHYPAQPASQSGLRVTCAFNNNTGTSIVSSRYSIHDFDVAVYHNGAARTVSSSSSIASGSTTFTISNFTGTTAFVNRPISVAATPGIGIPARTFVKSISGAGLVTLSNATTALIAANTPLLIDNTSGRSRTDVVTTAASTTITSATANFTAADVGLSVGGTFIPPDTTISSVTNATTVVLTNAATASGTAQTVTFGGSLLNTTTRSVTNAFISSATVVNSPAPAWSTDDIGLKLSGTGIPADTFVTSISGANATASTGGMTPTGSVSTTTQGAPACTNEVQSVGRLTSTAPGYLSFGGQSTAALASTTNAADIDTALEGLTTIGAGNVSVTGGPWPAAVTVTFTGTLGCTNVAQLALTQTVIVGDPSVTAPKSTDTVVNQGVQLNLNPVLVAGSDACFNNATEGFALVATWRNPGSFEGVGVNNAQPGGTKAIGQLYFKTAVVDFSGFVIQRPVLAPGDPIGTVHYDLVFPSVPTTAALCPSTATSTGLGFSMGVHAQTASQGALPSGVGKPGSAQFRSIVPQPGAGYPGYSSTLYVQSDDPAVTFTPAADFNRLCIYPSGAPSVGFGGAIGCGNG